MVPMIFEIRSESAWRLLVSWSLSTWRAAIVAISFCFSQTCLASTLSFPSLGKARQQHTPMVEIQYSDVPTIFRSSRNRNRQHREFLFNLQIPLPVNVCLPYSGVANGCEDSFNVIIARGLWCCDSITLIILGSIKSYQLWLQATEEFVYPLLFCLRNAGYIC